MKRRRTWKRSLWIRRHLATIRQLNRATVEQLRRNFAAFVVMRQLNIGYYDRLTALGLDKTTIGFSECKADVYGRIAAGDAFYLRHLALLPKGVLNEP